MSNYLLTYLISLFGLAIFAIQMYRHWDFKGDGPITRRHVLYAFGLITVPVVNTLIGLLIAVIWVVASFDDWVKSEPFKVVTDWLDAPFKDR